MTIAVGVRLRTVFEWSQSSHLGARTDGSSLWWVFENPLDRIVSGVVSFGRYWEYGVGAGAWDNTQPFGYLGTGQRTFWHGSMSGIGLVE
ncbi:hypothetical protein EAF04_002523 [Stromatinia cepivora]|nr:hypothetical protein EAF04_002523 [Stromatinia cepivora]